MPKCGVRTAYLYSACLCLCNIASLANLNERIVRMNVWIRVSVAVVVPNSKCRYCGICVRQCAQSSQPRCIEQPDWFSAELLIYFVLCSANVNLWFSVYGPNPLFSRFPNDFSKAFKTMGQTNGSQINWWTFPIFFSRLLVLVKSVVFLFECAPRSQTAAITKTTHCRGKKKLHIVIWSWIK